MDIFVEKIYLLELINQCEYASSAVGRMNDLMNKPKSHIEFFREAGDFLHHSSAASRMLWPPGSGNRKKKKRAKLRGEVLRKSLGISEGHYLEKRTLRDHFEHFDERLDDWVELSDNKNIVDNMIGPREALNGTPIEDNEIMRLFDPKTNLLIFRGETFDVQYLVDGVSDIKGRAYFRIAELKDLETNNHSIKVGEGIIF